MNRTSNALSSRHQGCAWNFSLGSRVARKNTKKVPPKTSDVLRTGHSLEDETCKDLLFRKAFSCNTKSLGSKKVDVVVDMETVVLLELVELLLEVVLLLLLDVLLEDEVVVEPDVICNFFQAQIIRLATIGSTGNKNDFTENLEAKMLERVELDVMLVLLKSHRTLFEDLISLNFRHKSD